MRRRLRPLGRLEAFALALTVAACAVSPPPPEPPLRPVSSGFIRLVAEPVPLDSRDPNRTRVGELTWRWGVRLRAEGTARFGGLSGLEVLRAQPPVEPSGARSQYTWRRFTVVTDEGEVFGWPAPDTPFNGGPIAATSLAGEDGRPLGSKAEADAEALARSDDGRWFVSFERRHRVRRYPSLSDLRTAAVPEPAAAPNVRLGENSGFEALAVLPLSGRRVLAVGAEDGRIWFCPDEGVGDCSLFLRGTPEPGFSLTGLDHLPGTADLVALYRSYNPLTGAMGALVARITSGAAGGRRGDVRVLARLRAPLTVDNMEGIAAVENDAGGFTLYLVSDDNFSPSQRTLLLAFDYAPTPTTASGEAAP